MNSKATILLILVFLLLFTAIPIAQAAAGTPQPGDPPEQVQLSTPRNSSSPWLGALVLIIAGVVYMYVKKVSTPANMVTGNCCAPVIDEAKMERERQKIAEKEKSPPLS